MENNTLECSTKGDKRFSSLYARIKIGEEIKSIENWYQLSKSFDGKRFDNFRDVKRYQHQGNNPDAFYMKGEKFEIKLISQFYKLMWARYLDKHPSLVEYASQFDDFTDCFRNKNTINCQCDVIKQYVKEGRESVLNDCKEFIDTFKEKKNG